MADLNKPTLAEALLIASRTYAYADADLLDAAVVLEDHDFADLAHEMWQEAERRALADGQLEGTG